MSIRLAAAMLCLLAPLSAQVQDDPLQCTRGSAGNRICIRVQPDNNTCGYGVRLFGAMRATALACDDAVVEKFGPRGNQIFSRVLAGESQDSPQELFLDSRGNIVVVGTTWSSRFPVTSDAVQPHYAGPNAVAPSIGRLTSGGDLFLTVLSPTGEITYSTFLGSPGNDEILEVKAPANGQVDLLVRTPGLQFPVDLAPSAGGPVLLTLDLARHSVMRSRYLPAVDSGGSAAYAATWTESGSAQVVTPSTVYLYARDGRNLSRASLKAPAFAVVPTATTDPQGDLWLTGDTASGQVQAVRLADGENEAARWTLPNSGGIPTISAPYFGSKGLVYLGGGLGFRGALRSTTANALLRAPCSEAPAFLAVIDRDGDQRMLSYALRTPTFSLKSGNVLAEWDGLNRVTVDLTSRPKVGCVLDALRPNVLGPFGVGQIVRVRGSGFGSSAPKAAAIDRGRLPTRMEGLRVRFDGIDAPIFATADGEAIAAIPYRVRPSEDGTALVVEDGDRSSEFQVHVEDSWPQQLGELINENGTVNAHGSPAAWGTTVSLLLTGAGPYSPSLADGEFATATRRLEAPVSVTWQVSAPSELNGEVIYAGAIPGLFGGVSRLTFRLPAARAYAYDSITAIVKIGSTTLVPLTVWVR
jgi:uncharacterized protein (TIGR03437 family)